MEGALSLQMDATCDLYKVKLQEDYSGMFVASKLECFI